MARAIEKKEVRKIAEDARVSVRSVRREGMDMVKDLNKKSVITEDELRSDEDSIQKLTDKYIAEVDKLLENKEKEIMNI